MAVLDYAALETALLTILQADQRLAGVTVDNGGGEPTGDTCPFIGLRVVGFERVPYQLTGSLNQGGPYLETVTLLFDCWQFSGQGGSDARAQVFSLGGALIAVLQDNPSIGNLVLIAEARRGEIVTDRATQGIFSKMSIEMKAQKFTP